jgi:hypothetical protein
MSYIDTKQVQLKDDSGNIMNPSSEEAVILLRKLIQLTQSLTVTDSAQRQRVVVDVMPSVGVSGTVNSQVTLVGNVDPRQQFQDFGRMMFATSIRSNIDFV